MWGTRRMSEILRLTAPTPEVQHLPTLFRRIQAGDIRIPALQRKFLGTEAEILELLESVYKGYPIGSVLFWRIDKPLLIVDRSELSPFPDVPERYPSSFVLDGLQRLSTLYGVFHAADVWSAHRFNVYFDLRRL